MIVNNKLGYRTQNSSSTWKIKIWVRNKFWKLAVQSIGSDKLHVGMRAIVASIIGFVMNFQI